MVFGGTGDLALRKLLPALYLRDREGQLPADTRIIGVSRSPLDDDGYRAEVREALSTYVAPDLLDEPSVDRLLGRLHHVTLDAASPDDWHLLHGLLKDRPRHDETVRVFYLAVAPAAVRPDLPAPRRDRRRRRQRPRGDGEADRPRPRLRPRGQRRRRRGLRRVSRSSGSTTTSARRASRTSSSPASPTPSSSRCGTPAGSTTCRSPSPRRSASASAAATTTTPARCATWCRTTCSSCSAWSPWSRRRTSAARPSATRSSRCSRRSGR